MKTSLRRYRSEKGATAIEYSLILSLLLVAGIPSVAMLRQDTQTLLFSPDLYMALVYGGGSKGSEPADAES